MKRGFVIIAQNSGGNDYIKCATVLCRSIKSTMPSAQVTLLTDKKENIDYFDSVVEFPYGDTCPTDNWKLANDWQVYEASPYDYTIKFEADMYIPRNVDWWWDILKDRDLCIASTIRNYKGEISTNRFYRKIFDQNKLPDAYNAITYFKKGEFAEKFFKIVRTIFENWQKIKQIIKCGDHERATTDVVYALAANVLGSENCFLPSFTEFSMVHMKQHIIETTMTDWSRELIYEISPGEFRINTIPQLYPVHYQYKGFANKIEREL